MEKQPRQISDQAQAEIDELRRIGVKVSDADVVLINALCWEIESPSVRMELSRGKPIKVGGAWLWPRTISAIQWFQDVGCNIGDGLAALAYCMAHGREDIELSNKKQVTEWYRALKCTRRELEAACSIILEQEEFDELPPSKDSDSASLGVLVQKMQSIHGGDVAMWERYVSFPYVIDMLNLAAAQSQAEAGKSESDIIKSRANLALAYALHKIANREENVDGE